MSTTSKGGSMNILIIGLICVAVIAIKVIEATWSVSETVHRVETMLKGGKV